MHIVLMGCGKMAGAIAGRWLDAGAVARADIEAVEPTAEGCRRVIDTLAIQCGHDAEAALGRADLVVLGIKPQQAAAVLPEWAPRIGDATVLSMLAGTTTDQIRTLLGGRSDIVRIMPNTPARIGQGCTAVSWPDHLPTARRDRIYELLAALGEVVQLPESRIDAFTSIAGSGPAYVFLFLQALQEAAERQGFTAEDAKKMAAATVRGAANLAAQEDRSFAALRKDVTSPGGTTQAAIGVLEAGELRELVATATERATARAGELAKIR